MHFEVYKDSSADFYFRLVGDFHRFILMGGPYIEKDSAIADIEIAKTALCGTYQPEIRKTETGEFFFELRDNYKRFIGNSCLFKTVQALHEKIQYIKPRISGVPLFEKLLP